MGVGLSCQGWVGVTDQCGWIGRWLTVGLGSGGLGGVWLFGLYHVFAMASDECLLLAVHHDVFAANGVSRICLERYLEVFGYHVYFASV